MFSRLLAGPAVPANQRSVLPALKGLPWWGAVLVAVGATAVGAIIDTDTSSSLGRSFKVFYLFGCLLAALAVRQRALFTAAAQPPLVAFIVGVTALYTLNSTDSHGIKEIILKVILPIANSFPWILLTFMLTSAVAIGRWLATRPKGQALFGKRRSAAARPDAKPGTTRAGASRTGTAQSGARKPAAKNAGAGRPASDTRKSGTAKPGAKQPASAADRSRAATKTARPRQDSARAADARRGTPAPSKRPAEKPAAARSSSNASADRPRRQPSPEARPAARSARPAAPAPAPADSPRPAARQRSAQSGETRPAPTQRRAASAAKARRRAAPQTIPARDPKTPRRTAGQLRDTGTIEDLTAGADDR